ncbi:hypothetical protein HY338_02370 [Candidatus Gottesmanbacteria bacterium]|nr:hypothetical protein [Candidatus Gottesmanbacteria bacterium]
MMILIHGEDISLSRKKLLEETADINDIEVIKLEGMKATKEDVILACETKSFLNPHKILIIENLFKGIIGKDRNGIIQYLLCLKDGIDIFFWEDRELEKVKINKYLSKIKSFKFQYPSSLFNFLDSIGVDNRNVLIPKFHELLRQTDTELIFYMIIRQWRNLIMVKDLGVPGMQPMPVWQAGKFSRQAYFFSLESLISNYRQLLAIDFKIKTSSTPYALRQLLDIFLLNL